MFLRLGFGIDRNGGDGKKAEGEREGGNGGWKKERRKACMARIDTWNIENLYLLKKRPSLVVVRGYVRGILLLSVRQMIIMKECSSWTL